jgi:formylglycine-generating enzyme required for sulfatase activity
MSRAPSFLRSAKGVVAYLIDSASLGLDPTLVVDLFDDTASAGDQLARIRDTLDTLLRERRDEARPVADLLIYYVGHGHTDDQGHLSLLVRRSRRGMEAETGIKAPDLARILKIAAPQQRRAVLLDCCFSEAAARDFIGQAGALDQAVAATAVKDLRDDQPQRGSLLLCSSPVGEVSMGAPKAERTLFTGAVLEVLRHGVEGAPSALSFADLRDAAYQRMLVNFGANAPRPVLHQVNAAHGDLTRTPAFPNRAAAGVQGERRRPEEGAEARWRAEGRIKVNARIIDGAPAVFGKGGWFKPGAGKVVWFKDHEYGPEMVVVPAGEFTMGSPENEPERFSDEGPLHKVTLARPFAVGRHAVTRRQFAAFVNNTNYKMEGGAYVWTGAEWKLDPNGSWHNPGFRQDDDHPVVCVNWNDARAYAAWLSEATGHAYRLLSEAEWEYAARAGTATPFWWGPSITPAQANYNGNFVYKGGGAKGEYRQATIAADSFEPNPWGLYNVHGNVWEWTQDCWHDSYAGVPSDGSAWTAGDCSRRVVRGGSWINVPRYLRAADRDRITPVDRGKFSGFRLGRTLTP